VNGRVVAHRYQGPGSLQLLWDRPFRNFVQMMAWADTGELVVEDASSPSLDSGDPSAEVALVDIETGSELGRAPIGAPTTMGMFCCPGYDRDFYVCSITGAVARVYVPDGRA
jgi:hypothetical protein